jgi:hypothetical protein
MGCGTQLISARRRVKSSKNDVCHDWLEHLADLPARPPNFRFREESRRAREVRSMSAYDPGCVKTHCRCYDSPVILREYLDEALR